MRVDSDCWLPADLWYLKLLTTNVILLVVRFLSYGCVEEWNWLARSLFRAHEECSVSDGARSGSLAVVV